MAPEPPPPDEEPIVELKPFEAQRFFEEEERGDDGGIDGRDAGEAGAEDSGSRIEMPIPSDAPRVPGYVVEGVIGRGATGVVFRARQEAVDRPVALKVLHPELVTNRRAVKRLKREARLAAKLAHPSIISAIDMGVQDGRWWYAMELVEGVSLSRRIAERGSLTERECLRLFSPLCDALQHAHEVGVVHRDIKPANILVDPRGRARLVDLGLAMGPGDPSITRTGSTLGTPHYVSPEQARDPSQADIRSDIWSLGATMYHAVCGRPPFSFDGDHGSGGVAEILSRVLYQPVVDPREHAANLSKGFSLLLRKCLTRDPDQRYQEPWELVADIETLRERRRLDLRGSQVDPFASRRPAWIGRALWLAAAGAAVLATWLLTARPWAERGGERQVASAPDLGDWPELEAIDQSFRRGELRHAEALAELRSPTLEQLPEAARFLQSGLVVRVRDDLDARVRDLVAAATAAVDGALAEHDFPAALRAVREGFAAELVRATGFTGVGDLPPGRVAKAAEEFQQEALRRVEEAHGSAVARAEQELQTAFGDLRAREMRSLVDAGRFRDALAWLGREDVDAWLLRDGIELDLRGLGPEERRRVASSLEGRLRSEESAVLFRASQAALAARDAMDDAERDVLARIEEGDVRGDVGAGERFAEEVRSRNEAAGFDPEQLPVDMAVNYGERREAALDGIERTEARSREELARRELRRLERTLQGLLRRRDLAAARALLTEARGEHWRAATLGAIDLWLEELTLVEEVLARIEAGLVAAEGRERTLWFGGVKYTGRVRAASRPLRDGFRLQLRSGSEPGLLVHVVDRAPAEESRMLSTRDAAELAGLSDVDRLAPRERLMLGAFLLAEGDPQGARRVLPLEGLPDEEALLWEPEQRIDRAIGVARASERAQAAAAAPPPQGAPERSAVGIESVYRTPNQATVGNDVRLAWWFVDEALDVDVPSPPLRHPIPRGEDRFGVWSEGRWRRTVDGLELDGALADRQDFLRPDFGPALRVLPPVDHERGVTARLTLRPGNPYPDRTLFAVDVEGYLALFVDGRAWFGQGDERALFEYVTSGGEGDFGGFESREGPTYTPDEEVVVEVGVRGKNLDVLTVGGRALGFHKFLQEPRRNDQRVRVRSRGPMVLLGAELVAEQTRVR